MAKSTVVRVTVALATMFAMLSAGSALAQPGVPSSNEHVPDVAAYWTPERMANAIPRDLVIDHRGLGYLRLPDGSLQPYGHQIAAVADRLTAVSSGSNPDGVVPRGKPDPSDSTPPAVDQLSPLGPGYSDPVDFSATITDASGIKSVSFEVTSAGGGVWQSFNPSPVGNDVWEIRITGFSAGEYQWRVIAKDNGPQGGNITIEGPVIFFVGTSTSTTAATTSSTAATTSSTAPATSNTVADANWTHLGPVDTAAGRIYFEMPSNAKRKGPWNGYVCSGTVVTDGTSGRSIVITAAHCVYDDVNKAFARNVLFIPKQYQAGATDRNCLNDPLGCWKPSFGVVDADWANRTWPANIPWDFAYYVFDDLKDAAHLVNSGGTLVASAAALDVVAGSLGVTFGVDLTNNLATDALGYSYSQDPNFRYCSEPLATPSDEFATGAGSYPYRWLNSCDLSGGASGGPWLQPAGTGVGPIISVNSWGWSNQPGMAGPILNREASCLFEAAKNGDLGLWSFPSGDQGVIGTCSGISPIS